MQAGFYYDETIVQGLPGFGHLTYLDKPEKTYLLQFGSNILGTSDSCTIQIDRFMHNDRCFISRRHCTITVTFDKWIGQLRYQLQDGFIDSSTQQQQSSLNGTLLNGVLLQKNELIDVSIDGIISLGGADRFQLTHYCINPEMLNTYKIELAFNPDRTQ
ncbi:FHA domain-containing protein [Spirosoma endbachense]|uniref:FHA domain-containing protein n=1 Tax=Spirosoma endbachense TaxID=2666025 RepID=UPI001E50A019|nr:FHA domain-containing protein [Spirosoma endbachense]